MTKEFSRQDGLDKLTKMVEDINVCMFLTHARNDEHVRPMATMKAEDNGTLWFFTKKSSDKLTDLHNDDMVRLLYSHPGKDSYVDISGKATIENDRQKVDELWTPLAKAWFPEGKDDPELCLLKVEVDTAYYWDSGTSKMISFFKMVAAAVTGKQLVEGEEGALVP